MRGVGISGVDCTGKSDLAVAYSKETDCSLLTFSIGDFLKMTRLRLTGDGVMKEYDIAMAQLESTYANAESKFVADMTPLDIMSELYSNYAWFNEPSEENEKRTEKLWEEACRICSRYLSVIMHIQPLRAGARNEHLSALGNGLIHTRLVNETTDTKMFTVRRDMVELDKRMIALKGFVFDIYEEESPYENTSSLKH